MNRHRTSHSHPWNRGERGYRLTSNSAQRTSGVGKDGVSQLHRRPAYAARPHQNREQLGTAERLRSEIDEPLSRPLRPRQLMNG